MDGDINEVLTLNILNELKWPEDELNILYSA